MYIKKERSSEKVRGGSIDLKLLFLQGDQGGGRQQKVKRNWAS